MPRQYRIQIATENVPSDSELEEFLYHVYVGEGFKTKESAEADFVAELIRGRGELLVAMRPDSSTPSLIGTAILVRPNSLACRLANATEAELHLLGVSSECRRMGIGRALVSAAMSRAREGGFAGMLLWTQPNMAAAHRLYESAGFVRQPMKDFQRNGRDFLVMRAEL